MSIPWKIAGKYPARQSNYGYYKQGLYRGEGKAAEHIHITGNNEYAVRAAAEAIIERDTLKQQNAELLAACESAIRYDAAIQKRAVDGAINIIDTGGAIAMGDDLDALYDDWIGKSRSAIKAEGR